MDHDGVAELLGAYALNAVDDDEAAAIEAHLLACDPCRSELDQHRVVAAQLAPQAIAVPDRLWASIAEATRPTTVAPIRPNVALENDASRGRRLASLAAAVILAFGVGTMVSEVRSSRDLRDAQERAARAVAVTAAFADPAARRVDLLSEGGQVALQAAIRPDGTGYLIGGALPSLDADMTYQVWAISPTGAASAGVLGPRPGTEPIRLAEPGATVLAVTRERRGGAPAPTSPPLVQGSLPTN